MSNKNEIAAARRIADSVFALGGPDLRGLSDDALLARLKEGTARWGAAMRATSVTAAQASESLRAFGRAARSIEFPSA